MVGRSYVRERRLVATLFRPLSALLSVEGAGGHLQSHLGRIGKGVSLAQTASKDDNLYPAMPTAERSSLLP